MLTIFCLSARERLPFYVPHSYGFRAHSFDRPPHSFPVINPRPLADLSEIASSLPPSSGCACLPSLHLVPRTLGRCVHPLSGELFLLHGSFIPARLRVCPLTGHRISSCLLQQHSNFLWPELETLTVTRERPASSAGPPPYPSNPDSSGPSPRWAQILKP